MPNKRNIAQLKELKDVFSKATSIYFTEYQGLNVGEITKLRGECYKSNIDFKVAKNTLLKMVINEGKYPEIDHVLKGNTAIAVSYDEPVSPAKVLKRFITDHELPKIKGILIDREYFGPEVFDKLSKMESKDVLLGQLISLLKTPLQNLVSTLNAPIQSIVGVLTNIKNKS
jgi:large subunit ribosomal protein L10